jgi:hypothetical protein
MTCTSTLGSLTTTPEGSRTGPIGSIDASSPRCAFLIAHDLVRHRLPDVEDGLPRQMSRLDQFGLHASTTGTGR